MAKNFVISGFIRLKDEASEALNRVDATIKALKGRAESLGEGGHKLGEGLKVAGAGGTLVAGGFGLAIKEASDFQVAMAQLNSVNDLTGDQFRRIRDEALHLGSTTVFSAKEATEGMTILSKAGLTVDQTLQAIPGVLAAAATEGLGLAQSADIVTAVLQGQNLKMSQSSEVADVLAMAANKTSAGMIDLGEAFKYASVLSQQGIMDFHGTAAALGVLSNAGLKGSIAGTSLTSMFGQIAKPSKAVMIAFGGAAKFAKTFHDETGKLKELPAIIDIIGKGADAQSNDLMRLRFLQDFVGEAGAKAFGALRRAVTQKDDKGRPIYDGLREDLDHSTGFAETVAKKRLDTVAGAFSMVHHEIAGILIGIGDEFLPGMRGDTDKLRIGLQRVSLAFQALGRPIDKRSAEDLDLLKSSTGQFVSGFVDGLREAIATGKQFADNVKTFLMSMLPAQEQNAAGMGKMVGKFLLLAATLGPIIIAGLGFVALLGSVFTGISGFITIVGALIPSLGTLTTVFGFLWSAASFVASGIWSITAAMLANPIGAIIAGVAVLVGGLYVLVRNWDSVKNAMMAFGAAHPVLAAIGDAIYKYLMFPIRATLTPLAELFKLLAGTSLGGAALSKIGLNPELVKDFADQVSVVKQVKSLFGGEKVTLFGGAPGAGPVLPIPGSQPAGPELGPTLVNPSTSVPALSNSITTLGASSAAATAGSQGQTPNVNVNVPQQAIQAQFQIDVNLDGDKVAQSITKRAISNTERRGQSIAPDARTALRNGLFIQPVGAQGD